MSMPSDLMSMLLGNSGGGGGIMPPLSIPGQTQMTPPPEEQMGPEEQKALAMFAPPKDENEVNQIHQDWNSWLEHQKQQPQFFPALAAFGAALTKPGGLGRNFAEGAALFTDMMAKGKENAKQQKLQEFGVLQQARGIDRQSSMQKTQLGMQQDAAKLDKDRFGLQQIESQENRSLALENLGIKKRELALSEAQSRSSIQRDGLQNGLLELQIKKIQKDLDNAGFYETTPGEQIGTTYVKEKANALMKADPKLKPDQALEQAMKEYTASAASFVPTATGQVTPKDEWKAKIELMKAQIAGQVPGLAGKDPAAIASESQAMVTAAKGTQPGNPGTSITPEMITSIEAKGYQYLGYDSRTNTISVSKDGKIEKIPL